MSSSDCHLCAECHNKKREKERKREAAWQKLRNEKHMYIAWQSLQFLSENSVHADTVGYMTYACAHCHAKIFKGESQTKQGN